VRRSRRLAGKGIYFPTAKGYTWGGAVEIFQKDLRPYFLRPDVSNSNTYDTRLLRREQCLFEIEQRFSVNDGPTKLRLGLGRQPHRHSV
jgi:hypothetical protein